MLESWLMASGYQVWTAGSGSEALARVKQVPIDVVITDLKMPDISGLDLLAILKERDPSLQVLILSGQAGTQDAIDALRGGRAFDFILKPLTALGQLNLSIERALAQRRQAATRLSDEKPSMLSDREIQIVALVAEGLENRDIAGQLCISENTVKNHLARIYRKLKVSNRVQVAMACTRMGWL